MSRWMQVVAVALAAVVGLVPAFAQLSYAQALPEPVARTSSLESSLTPPPPGAVGLLFVVIPGCPACIRAAAWLGEAQRAFPDLNLLLVSPWPTEELQALSSQTGVVLLVDEGGRIGAGLGVRRAPTAVFLLDRFPLARLEWPFTEADLFRGLADLAGALRGGPWRLLGTKVSISLGRTLEGELVDLDALSRPLLLVFFNPDCPPCWDALPGLIELREKILIMVVGLASHTLAADGRERLREAGLMVVYDEGDLVRTFAVRVTPTYVILDGEGVIRWVHKGIVEQEVLRLAVVDVVSKGLTDE